LLIRLPSPTLLRYISPELLEHNKCSSESDLWSFGCILFKMYAGETPFLDKNEYQVF